MKLLKNRYFAAFMILVLFVGAIGLIGHTYMQPSMRWFHSSILLGKYPAYYKLDEDYDQKVYFGASEFSFEEIDVSFSGEELWNRFHFLDVEIILPVDHSSFILAPLIKYNGKGEVPTLGLSVYGPTQKPRNYFIIGESFTYRPDYYSQKLFEIPYNFRYLLSIPMEKLWEDLFVKDLYVGDKPTYKDYLYQLFLLHSRLKLFPKDVKKISYIKSLKTGVLELPYIDPKFRKEMIWKSDRGVVRTYFLVTRRDDVFAEEVRRKIMTDMKFKLANRDGVEQIYADYKKLSFEERISDKGMIFLFSALSQDLDNRDILKQMIHFLEKGRNNFFQLRPLYDYAYVKYGTNMSRREEILIERAKEKLERLAKEKLQERLKKIEALTIRDDGYRKFATPEEEVLFKLKEAKESPEDLDASESKLYIP